MSANKSLVLFGDSLLGRFGKSLIQQLENELQDTIVYNCAAGGLNTEDGRTRVKFISKLKPDIVVLSFGANDCAPWKEQVPLEKFANNLQEIIKAFNDSQVVMFPCPPAQDSIDLTGTQEFNELLKQYNSEIQQIALKMNAKVIDSTKVYGELLKSGNDYHLGDGIHLNEVGYGIFIKELVKVIRV